MEVSLQGGKQHSYLKSSTGILMRGLTSALCLEDAGGILKSGRSCEMVDIDGAFLCSQRNLLEEDSDEEEDFFL